MVRFGHMIEAGAVRRLRRAAAAAGDMDRASLKALRARALELNRNLDDVIHATEARLLPGKAIPRPLHTEWAMRPELWRGPVQPPGMVAVKTGARWGREAKIFHDGVGGEVLVRQGRNAGPGTTAPFSVIAEVFHFEGSFLSIAIDLPAEGSEGLSRNHLVRVGAEIESERPVQIFTRLNLRFGPNVATLTEQLDAGGHVDLDLAACEFDEDRLAGAWLDLIVDAPSMNAIRFGDVTVSRRPRAQV